MWWPLTEGPDERMVLPGRRHLCWNCCFRCLWGSFSMYELQMGNTCLWRRRCRTSRRGEAFLCSRERDYHTNKAHNEPQRFRLIQILNLTLIFFCPSLVKNVHYHLINCDPAPFCSQSFNRAPKIDGSLIHFLFHCAPLFFQWILPCCLLLPPPLDYHL